MKIIYFFILIIFVSCSNEIKKSDVSLESINIITFDLGFNTRSKYSGVFFDKSSEKEYFYFFNPNVSNEFKFYFLDGKLKSEISLKNIPFSIENINTIALDSILVISRKNGLFYLLNDSGDVKYKLNINDYLDSGKYKTLIYPSIFSSSYKNGNLLLDYELDCWDFDNSNNYSRLKLTQDYYKIHREKTRLIYVKNIFDKPETSFVLKGFYARFIKNNGSTFELSTYSIDDSNAYLISLYSDSIYKYNYILDDEKINSFKIESNHLVEIKVPNYTYNANSDISGVKIRENYRGSNSMNRLYHFKPKNWFLVCVTQKRKLDKEANIIGFQEYWNLLIYDNKFNKLGELLIERSKYKESSVMCTSEGIFLEINTESDSNYNPKIKKYELFKINI